MKHKLATRVGRNTKMLREYNGIGPSELSRKAGISRQTLTRVEAGNGFWHSTVERLARALGVQPWQMLLPTQNLKGVVRDG